MSLLTINDAIEQCRADSDAPLDQLQAYMDAADAAVSAYLNRTVYTDADALTSAQDGVADAMLAASTAYSAAVAAAQAMTDSYQQAAALALAGARLAAAQTAANRTINGIAANPAILAATRLVLGHLYANREDVIAGPSSAAVQLPGGATDILRPYRLGMMP